MDIMASHKNSQVVGGFNARSSFYFVSKRQGLDGTVSFSKLKAVKKISQTPGRPFASCCINVNSFSSLLYFLTFKNKHQLKLIFVIKIT